MERSKYIYFNIHTCTFVFTNEKKSSKKYIVLPADELYKLAKRNIASIRNYIIKESFSSSFFHFSTSEITKLSIPNEQPPIKNIYTKPPGMWVSHGLSWLDYIEKFTSANECNLVAYTYRIELYGTVKVITDKDSLFAFIKKYKKKPDDMRIYDVIDWDKVKEECTGLIITPHLGNKIWRDNYSSFSIQGLESAQDFFSDLLGSKWKNNTMLLAEWYRFWVCQGGFIFSTDAIASFNLIKRTNFKKYLN